MEEDLFRRLSAITQFEFPALPNNIPFACHPDFGIISQQTDEWIMCKLKVDDQSPDAIKIREARIGLFVSMMHPRGDTDKVILAGKHLWTMFLVDDQLETTTTTDLKDAIWREATATQQQPQVQKNHNLSDQQLQFLSMLCEIVSEFIKQMSPLMYKRYLKVLSQYLDAVGREADHAEKKTVPTPEEYRRLRVETGFMEVMANIMSEFCMGIELRECVTEMDDFRRMIDRISDHIVLVNDVLSFRKEYFDGKCHNWVSVLFCHSSPETFQQVIEKLRDMIQEEEDEILRLQKKLTEEGEATGDEELVKAMVAYPLSASGHLRWSYITARYHGCNNTLLTGEVFSGTWMMHREATIVLPFQKNVKHPYLIS